MLALPIQRAWDRYCHGHSQRDVDGDLELASVARQLGVVYCQDVFFGAGVDVEVGDSLVLRDGRQFVGRGGAGTTRVDLSRLHGSRAPSSGAADPGERLAMTNALRRDTR
jgi:hypothetical protein